MQLIQNLLMLLLGLRSTPHQNEAYGKDSRNEMTRRTNGEGHGSLPERDVV